MTKPGFIQLPWSHQRGDSILAASVIQRIENESMHGCGLYYEIYYYRVIRQLYRLLKTLNTADRQTLINEATDGDSIWINPVWMKVARVIRKPWLKFATVNINPDRHFLAEDGEATP